MDLQNKISILKKSLIFSGLRQEELEELAKLTTEKRVLAREFVFLEEEMPACFHLVAEGRVKIVKRSSTGKDFIVAFFGPEEIIGEVAVFQGRPYPASAEAVSDSVILNIDRARLISFLSKRSEVTMRIIGVLGGRLRDAQERLRDLAGERVEQRLARILLRLSCKHGYELSFTRQQFADMAGTTTETAIRFVSNLKDRKIVRAIRGKIIILDSEKLRIISEGLPRI